jgi:amidase
MSEQRKPSSDGFDRRELLVGGALGAFALAGNARADQVSGKEMNPLDAAVPGDAVPPFEHEEISLSELAEGMATGRFTARGITEMYLGRIEAIDQNGVELHSVIETNPDALDIAEVLDRERKEKGPRGPLHGIPILLKDNIATHDRTTTTAGSLALEGSIPPRDSFVAQKLRQAGAVLLGKANLSEWANFRSTRSTSGWSSRGRQCKNPYALDRSPCGSSAGSGASVSANLTAAAIGTETNGSIMCPASANGVVGIKPTVGLVSRSRVIPISHTQDTCGPMARTVHDAALVLGALTGLDPEDAVTANSQGHRYTDYTQFLNADGLRGARIGVARKHFGFHPGVDDLMEAAIQEMARRGAVIVDRVETPGWQELGQYYRQGMRYEFKAGLNAYLAALGPEAPVKTLAEVIDWNERHRESSMPYFGQEIFIEAQEFGPLTEKKYIEGMATARRLSRDEGIDKTMNEHRLDAIVAPTGGPAWTIDLVNADHFGGGSSTAAAVAGYPNITVPAGYVFGLPVGISFFGRAWSEPVLLKIAYGFEQSTKHRVAPKFLRTLDLG